MMESRLELQQLQQQQQQRRRTSAGNYDIPIFTEEFLDHNKHVDLELRLLRKSNTDFDQQNAVLERHVEHMNTGVAKLQADSADLARTNAALQVVCILVALSFYVSHVCYLFFFSYYPS